MTVSWHIHELLPHAGDMILLDRVEACDDLGLTAVMRVKRGLYSQADGSLPAWIGIEIMAQAIAAYAGVKARQADSGIRMGFLLGTRRYHCNVAAFPVGVELSIGIQRTLEDSTGMGVFDCQITGPGIAVAASLNVFQPPNAEQYLQGEDA